MSVLAQHAQRIDNEHVMNRQGVGKSHVRQMRFGTRQKFCRIGGCPVQAIDALDPSEERRQQSVRIRG